MIGVTHSSISREEILKSVTEAELAGFYLGVDSIPTVISSPLRQDANPSLSLYSPNGDDVNYYDHANGERGGIFSLLMVMFKLTREQLYAKISEDIIQMRKEGKVLNIKKKRKKIEKVRINSVSELKCRTRDWQQHDIDYWNSYGIELKWLKWANVHPISHIIYTDGVTKTVIAAERYAYVFPEFKEGKTTIKIYQPFSKERKWRNSHDKSVLGLWKKLPEKGRSVVICSSVKDALCLMTNMRIPCICVQGERFPVSQTAMGELQRRFTDVFCCYDNDKAGREDAKVICDQYGLINMEIPQFEGGKDISDYYKSMGRERFVEMFRNLIIDSRERWYNELPF